MAASQSVLKPELARLGYEGEFHKLPGKSTSVGLATFWHSRTFRLLKVRQPSQHRATPLSHLSTDTECWQFHGTEACVDSSGHDSAKVSMLSCLHMQSHNINLNTVAKDAAKDARVEAKGARLLNNSGSLALVLQVRRATDARITHTYSNVCHTLYGLVSPVLGISCNKGSRGASARGW